MGKKDRHKTDLIPIMNNLLKTKNEELLIKYFIRNSNLPGRRANLEMAAAFTEVIEEQFTEDLDIIFDICEKLIQISPEKAPTNEPREILPFCGVCAIGKIGALSEKYFPKSIIYLKDLANDSRWRMREAVRIGIERILLKNSQKVTNELENWVKNDNWLEMRAVAAGVAYPKALENQEVAYLALNLHKKIFVQIINSKHRRNENFKILKKGLCYTLSVVTQAVPDEGFDYMKQLLGYNDKDINQIIKENLKKNRLKKNFPKRVKSLNISIK
ncbi:MAG: hypothetical protein ACFFCQ_08315 [Promethearchaeota archaeon]